jgi:hypothetical protein
MNEPKTRPSAADRNGVIVVVHGFAGSRLWMLPLCWRLRSRVTTWC